MDIVIAALLGAAVVAALFWGVRSARTTPPGAPGAASTGVVLTAGRAVVTLDVGAAAATSPAAGRLVDDAAGRVFATMPDATEVEVRDREGGVLGRRRRETPLEVDIPNELYEPHARADRTPDPRDGLTDRGETLPAVDRDRPPPPGIARPLAERFELPDAVRSRLDDPDDAVALVRALLEAAGLTVERDGDVLSAGDAAVVVIPAPIGEPLTPDALNRAYRRFRDSGASRGVVVTPGFMDPTDVRRREVFVPSLLHAGPEGIQRMADAVELGADPVRFAAAPAFRG